MSLTHTTILLNNFNNVVTRHIDEIQEKELKIILALSDLLEEPDEYEDNFINKSLKYLKENYALDKSVWKVLLKLYEEIPDFCEVLSDWEEPGYAGYVGDVSPIYKFAYFNCRYPIKNHDIGKDIREYNIKKLFYFIGLLCKHFSTDESSAYIGLFIKEFDIKKSPFSINNLIEFSKRLRENGEGNISTYNMMIFSQYFNMQNNLYFTLRKLYYYYFEIKYPQKWNNKENFKIIMEFTFNRMNIQYTNVLETFHSIIASYKKYTNEEFISYKGLIELKSKTIALEDKININYLLTEFDKSEKYNEVQSQVFIELIKLVHKYNDNVLKGIDKREIIHDYLGQSNDFIKKAATENDFSLNNLISWSNEWHKKGESRGKKEEFQVHDIDMIIDNYVLEQIKDSHQLHEEGKTQSHCVYTYKSRCLKNQTIIISMKNNKGERVSTIRLEKGNKVLSFFKKKQTWYIAENRKRFNKTCSTKEKEVAQKYFSLIQEKIKLIK
jgi:hypothetical protein